MMQWFIGDLLVVHSDQAKVRVLPIHFSRHILTSAGWGWREDWRQIVLGTLGVKI